MPESLPVILLPGLGLDERLFAVQKLELPGLQVPAWLKPRYFETLPEFGRRMAQAVDPGKPCYVGGMSFGGMVALEMSRHLDCRGCFLISSIRSREELPVWAKILAPGAWLLPPRSDLIGAAAGTLLLWTVARLFPPRWQQFCVHLGKMRAPILPWACRAVVAWRPSPVTCPVHQIHGDRDPILPHHQTRPDQIVPRAGHLLPLTHPYVVSNFLRHTLHTQAGTGSA